jgi:KDO2-lipid IV(A) lauroyltransferase
LAEEKQRAAAQNWIEYLLARLVLWALAAAPRAMAFRLARLVMRLLDRAVPKLRHAGRANIEMAMPDLYAPARERLIDGVFDSLARALVALSRFPSLSRSNVEEWIRYEGREHFERALERGRGVMFFTAHLGNWELSAYAHGLLSAPMHVVVRPLDNPLLDRLAARYRAGSGNRLIGKKEFARGILAALSANEAVGILADQNASLSEGVFVDFFGHKACAHAGFARIAAHSGAVVIPGFAIWSEKEQRYVLRFDPPVEMTGNVEADTQRLHSHLERVIREYPDQWLWIHRRWKTRPPDEAAG